MAGLVPAIHVLAERKGADARHNGMCSGRRSRTRVPGMTWRDFVYAHRTSTFLNCHGSLLSMSSGNSPGRSVSGVQSV